MKRARTETSKNNRKQEILMCAEDILVQEGLAGLSLQKVAKKSNLAIGTIYLYFEKKEDLIASLTIKSRQFLLQQFQKSVQPEDNALTQISNVLEAYYHFYKSHPHYNELVSFFEKNAGLEEPEALIQASFEINQLVIDIVKVGKQQQLIRPDLDETTFSFVLWGTGVGIIQLLEVKKEGLKKSLNISEIDFFKSYISLIINSLRIG